MTDIILKIVYLVVRTVIKLKETGIKIPEETVEEKDISPPMKQ